MNATNKKTLYIPSGAESGDDHELNVVSRNSELIRRREQQKNEKEKKIPQEYLGDYD